MSRLPSMREMQSDDDFKSGSQHRPALSSFRCFLSLPRFLPGYLRLAVVLIFYTHVANASCPLCPAIGARTISEEMIESDVILFGQIVEQDDITAERLEHRVRINGESAEIDDEKSPQSPEDFVTIKVLSTLAGSNHFSVGDLVTVPLPFGNVEDDLPTMVVATAVDSENPAWNTPIRLTNAARDYVGRVHEMNESSRTKDTPVQRLVFYQSHLESEDDFIATDAYDEFARAPYEDVIAMRDKMDHDRIVEWIQSEAVPSSRRRLFFMMLGVCGDKSDLPLLESMIIPTQVDKVLDEGELDDGNLDDGEAVADSIAGIDAIIACYLTLAGKDGLPTIQQQFFCNHDREYSDIYSALMAVRFHGTEGGVFETDELLPLLRCLLDRPQLADLVIPDLARWEDWTVLPRLVEIFRESDGKLSWMRVPIFNYLKVCPLPEADAAVEELKQLDPDAFRRSNQLFPLGEGDDTVDSEPVDS